MRRARGIQISRSLPFLAVIGGVLGAPLVVLFIYSFRASTYLGLAPGYTFEQYSSVVTSGANQAIALRSLVVGMSVAAIVSVIAFIVAYALTFRMSRRVALPLLAVIVGAGVAPFLVRIYAWGTILGTEGMINRALEGIGLISSPLEFLFFGYFAVGVTMVYLYLPIGILIAYSAMQGIDARAVEASRDLGAGRWRTALRVVAPQAKVGMVRCFILIAVLACSDYVTPSLVGGPRGQMIGGVVFETALTLGNIPQAAALSFSYVVAMFLAIALIGMTVRGLGVLKRRIPPWGDGAATWISVHTPPRFARTSASAAATWLITLYLIAPTLIVLFFSFNSGNSVGLPFRGFTVDWYGRIVDVSGFTGALQSSAELAALALALAIAIGIPAAFALGGGRSRGAALVAATVPLPYVMPGVLIGVGILTAATASGVPRGTFATLLAHTLLVTPLVVVIVGARVAGLDQRLIEAARDLGSTPARAFRTITAPLVLPSVVGAALLAVVWSLDELIVTSFTIGPDSTIPVWLYGQARRGFDPGINALGVMLMTATLLLFAIAVLLVGRVLVARTRDANAT